ncbi:Naphthalene 1,2-dioxygenase system ferredoxin subunit [Pigmentiphaga humi]|uniref:Naphthalene 1,2-dioxygenase system ferredoxin subunit n=1 Tax=Pigmentiphaga humi TaxID=2478468 RepID=A0A3P4AX50_9BURK|nr:non-heme iron oxygenase ferredoxin subunit [Pigmentiphaga humi]VCU68617.1 Naphthalene 1,2-dioxygenase system ferredoxin subunit [Pigmentiphaga humi]
MNWTRIAKVADVGDDEGMPFNLDGKELALFRSDGEFFATDNVCTHQYALLSDGYVEDGCVECPLHQAQFDLRTGEAKCAPATQPIRVYPIKVEEDDIYVAIE